MSTLYLLDTNIASYIIRENMQVLRRLQANVSEKTAISVLTEAELMFGIERRPEAARLNALVNRFLASNVILEWTSTAAYHFARERAVLERKGQLLADIDMMIAAHALAEDAVLVTNDAAFRRIDHLKVEDWTD